LNLDLVALGRRGLCDLDELATAARPETGRREVLLLLCCLGRGGRFLGSSGWGFLGFAGGFRSCEFCLRLIESIDTELRDGAINC
jgi:hypothetical protein